MSHVREIAGVCVFTGACKAALILALLAILASGLAWAGDDPNQCDTPDDEPDVIVGDLYQEARWGQIGDTTAFSIGTHSCNIGTCWLNWFANTPDHPVISQNMYRLMDGRFEHIGQSWLKHGFTALDLNLCSNECIDTSGTHLGVNCSDPYSAGLNGSQNGLGPKFEINAATGEFPYPATDESQTGNAIYKRLQVNNDDLEPDLNPGALYFVEGHYIARDDALAGNDDNNASYRRVTVNEQSPGVYHIDLEDQTVRELPGIYAWEALDPEVSLTTVDVPGDGRFIIATKVTILGAGQYRYEYAVHNFNSHRSARSFTVPVLAAATNTNVGFHDVSYHSGEPYDDTDWIVNEGNDSIAWATESFGTNPDANALRWATLYNFRFDTDAPPGVGQVEIGLFRPGSPISQLVTVTTPTGCNDDGTCDPVEECGCPNDCSGDGSDGDLDGVGQCVDCDDSNNSIWATPGPVPGLLVDIDELGESLLTWSVPPTPGASIIDYEVLRANIANGFAGPGAICVPDVNPADTFATDPATPNTGQIYNYVVRAVNSCEDGVGPIDDGSESRKARSCP